MEGNFKELFHLNPNVNCFIKLFIDEKEILKKK